MAGRGAFLYPRANPMSALPSASSDRIARAIASGRRWVVLAMLLALHMALVSEPEGTFQRIWLLVHFGLFLLWQPFFAGERELEVFSVVLLLAITAVTLYYVSGWLVVGWLIVLMGVLGGRVFTVRAALQSRFYLVAFTYVVTMLLLWAVPQLILGERVPDYVADFARWGMPLALAFLLFLPYGSASEDQSQVFDFFYAVLVFQLGIVLVLGSIALMRFTHDNYIASVALTVLGFGLALFVFAVLWNPSRGFGGLRTYLSRYLLSVGMPFELWVRRVAELAETETDSHRFVEAALREISALPWVRGGHWKAPDGEGSFGRPSEHTVRFEQHDLEIVFHAELPLSPALFLHMRLLAQVVGEFHDGKRREAAMRQNAYLQAVHETGARLTHDVKNLLQSIYALTSMAPRDSSDGYASLLQRQLPQLSKRLEATIEKLRAPEVASTELAVAAHTWWNELRRRLEASGIEFAGDVGPGRLVPSTLFDSFVENALENARAKAESEAGVRITIVLDASPDSTMLSVTDTGSAVPAPIARRLFEQPVERDNGLGIGLFHTARLARQSGYDLELVLNRDGCVCFSLSGGRAV
jgi:signal transduction histidine kinase